MAASTASAPFCGVSTRELPTTRRFLTTTVWILVPPRSTPATSPLIPLSLLLEAPEVASFPRAPPANVHQPITRRWRGPCRGPNLSAPPLGPARPPPPGPSP